MTATTIVTTRQESTDSERVNLRSLLWIGPLILVSALVINTIIRLAAVSFNLAPTFFPIQGPAYIPFTIIGVLGALVAFVLVARFSKRPYLTYRNLAIGALVVTFIPDLLLLVVPFPGAPESVATVGPVAGVLSLMLMHTCTAAIIVGLLNRFTRAR